MFLSSTYYDMWLYRRTMVDLFVGFHVIDSNDRVISIKQIKRIKYLFVNMLHQIINLRYFRYLIYTNYVSLESFLIAINLDVMLSSNVFNTLIYVLRCNVLLL